MNIKIEGDSGKVHGTKIWIDGEEITQVVSIHFDHTVHNRLSLKIIKWKTGPDGKPYIDPATERAPQEVIEL